MTLISFHELKKKYQFSITILGLNYFVFNLYIVQKKKIVSYIFCCKKGVSISD